MLRYSPCRSPPAQNAFSPAPCRMTIATAASAAQARRRASSSSTISSDRPLRVCGALSVATPRRTPLSAIRSSNSTGAFIGYRLLFQAIVGRR
ncbi:Uncharacterised protein [Bordetella pertussis]|nr:Uncharacterised protein [Bordetella pertussis]